MHHRPRHLLIATALLALPTPLFAQFTSTWLAPVSGSWDTASNWSNGVPAGNLSHAVIDATGAPYTIAAWSIASRPVDLLSPDATVTVAFNFYQADVNLAAGAMTFNGSSIDHTTIRGTVPFTVASSDVDLNDLTLATDLVGAGPGNNDTRIFGRLTLDHGTVHLSSSLRPIFTDDVQISGTGTLLVDGGCSAYLYPSRYNTSPVSLTLDPGVQLKTSPGGGAFSLDSNLNSPRITNYGTISAEHPNTSIRIGSDTSTANSLSLTNLGLLSASNGGALSVSLAPGTSPGNVSLSTGGSLTFSGADYTLDQPLTVPAGTRLQLGGNWNAAAPLTVDAGGTLAVSSAPTAPAANVHYTPGSTLQLVNTLPAAALPLLNTTPSTTLSLAGYLDLGGAAFSLASVPGQWTYAPRLFADVNGIGGNGFRAIIMNGTLSAGAVGNDLLPNGGSVELYDVTVDFPLAVDHGTLLVQGTTFAQPVSVSGTGRIIVFPSAAAITATGGTIELRSQPTSPGAITMSGDSTLQLDFSTTLDQAAALPFGSPGTIAAGPRGVLDLQSAAVDLSTSPFQLALSGAYNPAALRNGTLTDPSHTHPIRVYPSIPGGNDGNYRNQFANLSCSADIIIDPLATLNLFNSSLHDSHLSGGGTLTHGPATVFQTTTLDHVTLDGVPLHAYSNSPLTVTNGLTTNATITIDPGSTVDLTTSTLLLNHATPSPADTIRTYLLDARLQSSSADPTHRLGYLDSGSSLTVRLALTGDANLDGVVNADDYALLDRGYAKDGSFWWQGDFNYDGLVDQNDYLLIDTTLGQAQGFSPGFLSMRESQFGAAYVSTLLSAVPEPSLPLFAASGLAFLPRSRK